MVTSVLIRTQASRKGSFPLDSVSVRVPGVEMLYIIYVQFGEGSGFEPGRSIAPIPHCNWNCPFKKRPRGQFVPLKF